MVKYRIKCWWLEELFKLPNAKVNLLYLMWRKLHPTVVDSLLCAAQAVQDKLYIQHLLLEVPPIQAQSTIDKTERQIILNV